MPTVANGEKIKVLTRGGVHFANLEKTVGAGWIFGPLYGRVFYSMNQMELILNKLKELNNAKSG